MTNEDFNSGFADFINSVAKQAALRKGASELADSLTKIGDDDTILEFLCWFFDRLGNKHDKDVISLIARFTDHFTERYHKEDAEDYESHDNYGEFLINLMKPHDESLANEWDETLGSDDSSLWDDID